LGHQFTGEYRYRLEFDAGIIAHELQHAGLGEWCSTWEDIAKQGFCTMTPEVGEWTARSVDANKQNHVQTLSTLADLVLPSNHQALKAQRHRAGPDAVLEYWVYCTMLEGAKYHRIRQSAATKQ